MANREISLKQFTRRNKYSKELREPKYKQRREKTRNERERILEEEDAKQQIKEYMK